MNHAPTASGKKKGFTLVETLVAITILTLSILAPFDAIERVVNASRLAKDQLIAASLAQEALEFVRFFRTSNYLAEHNNPPPYTDLMDGMDGNGGSRFGGSNCSNKLCTIDGSLSAGNISGIIGTCSSANINSCDPLYTTSTGLYTQDPTAPNTQTIFRRGFSYDDSNETTDGYVTVTVVVRWEDHGRQTMTLSENFYDWY